MRFTLIVFTSLYVAVFAQKNPNYVGNRTTMVHLFEWKFNDIAKECESFLGPMGYAGVQVSPIHENLIMKNRPWFERYQPISYKIVTRSGNESEFRNMVRRCNKVGVRIYVDAVVNHMTGDQAGAIGTGGSTADTEKRAYPGAPYSIRDFHEVCKITDYTNATNVRNCELEGLHDLDHSKEHVRNVVVNFFDRAVDAGVAGFRVDAAKHMWPKDLEIIYSRVKNVSTEAGFPPNTRPYFFQEVIDLGGEASSKEQYSSFASVIEFQYGIVLAYMFRGQDNLKRLSNWGDGPAWRLLPSQYALVMIDNHDNQRGHGAGGEAILTYKNPKEYRMAIAFMLAHPYGITRIMSSFYFNDPSQGPPSDKKENILSPEIGLDGLCKNGWVCEHRWPQIYRMVKFRNIVNGEQLQNWWTNGNNQIAFSRGSKGFVAFNTEKDYDLRQVIKTGLPAGLYCDVISGERVNGKCTGKVIQVLVDGTAMIEILRKESDGALAIHIEERL